jgi:hypothetical protein
MFKQKKSLAQIKNVTEVPKTAVYWLHIIVRERGWRKNKNMSLETKHVLNTSQSKRLLILINTIKCVLKVILQNLTIRGFSCAIIAKEVRKRGHEIAFKIDWKVFK